MFGKNPVEREAVKRLLVQPASRKDTDTQTTMQIIRYKTTYTSNFGVMKLFDNMQIDVDGMLYYLFQSTTYEGNLS